MVLHPSKPAVRVARSEGTERRALAAGRHHGCDPGRHVVHPHRRTGPAVAALRLPDHVRRDVSLCRRGTGAGRWPGPCGAGGSVEVHDRHVPRPLRARELAGVQPVHVRPGHLDARHVPYLPVAAHLLFLQRAGHAGVAGPDPAHDSAVVVPGGEVDPSRQSYDLGRVA
ncbi:conserved hypothetical protein, partial [Ricinus communis]